MLQCTKHSYPCGTRTLLPSLLTPNALLYFIGKHTHIHTVYRNYYMGGMVQEGGETALPATVYVHTTRRKSFRFYKCKAQRRRQGGKPLLFHCSCEGRVAQENAKTARGEPQGRRRQGQLGGGNAIAQQGLLRWGSGCTGVSASRAEV